MNLSNDLIQHIMSFNGSEDELNNYKTVCNHWNNNVKYSLSLSTFIPKNYHYYLREIDISEQGLTGCITIPEGVRAFKCNLNKLTIIKLSSTLVYLDCSFNRLKSILCLPPSLKYLNCGYNKLTTLPKLPKEGLVVLECYRNRLTLLPKLPLTLTYLDCSANFLSSLPDLPSLLISLYCNENPLCEDPFFSPILPEGLEVFCRLWKDYFSKSKYGVIYFFVKGKGVITLTK